MGDHAQDAIEKGMMEDYPFGPPRNKRFSRNRRQSLPKKITTPPLNNVDDAHFTWWWDAQDWVGSESPYERASMAWHEAVRRCTERNK